MGRAYAIGDIHGHVAKLREAHFLIEEDRRRVGDHSAPVVHLGDLVDRGPHSRDVIDFLIDGMAANPGWVVLRGNHDHMFARFILEPDVKDEYLRDGISWLHPAIGGRATLESYGIASTVYDDPRAVHAKAVEAVPNAHVAFLAGLPLWHRHGEAIFVHGGIKPGVAMAEQSPNDLMWIRAPFHNDTRDHGALVVHGHTPVAAATHYGNRLNVDSGAAFGGPLSAVVIEGREAWLLTPGGREPLLPVWVGDDDAF